MGQDLVMAGQLQRSKNPRYISKRLRFLVLERDRFTCQYCGRTVPDVVLVIDHITPVASGGGAEYENLITACIECNQGKAAGDLIATPEEIRMEQIALTQDHQHLLNALADVLFALNSLPTNEDELDRSVRHAWGELYEQCAEWQVDGGKRLLDRPRALPNPRQPR